MNKIKINFFYQTMYQILTMILPLVTSPILSRALGATGLGIYSYTTNIVNYFILFANLGIYRYGIRCIASAGNDRKKRSQLFWEILLTHCIISFVVFVTYMTFVFFVQVEYFKYYLVLSLMLFGEIININWFFFGIEEYKNIAIRDMVIKCITFLLIIFFVKNKNSLYIYFIIMTTSSLISNSIYFFMIKGKVDKTKIDIKNITLHFKQMIILFIPAFLETMYISIDKIMLGNYGSKTMVGYFDNAEKALISKTLIYSLTNVMFPRMSFLLSENRLEEFDQLMTKSTNIIYFSAIAFAFGTASVAKEFAIVFWGTDFIACVPIIMVLAFTIPANVLSREIRDQYLIPKQRNKEYIMVMAIGAGIDIMLDIALIPILGAVGAAYATLITEYLMLVIQIIMIKKDWNFLKYFNFKDILSYVMFGLCMMYTCRMVGNYFQAHLGTLVLEILVGIVIFISLSLVYWKITNNKMLLGLVTTIVRRKNEI